MLRASCLVMKLALDASERKLSLFSRLGKFPLMSTEYIMRMRIKTCIKQVSLHWIIPSRIESNFTFCPYFSQTFCFTPCQSGRCLASPIPGVWWVCVRIYLADTFPSFPFITVILDIQYPSSSVRDTRCFLVWVVFFGRRFSLALPSRQHVYNTVLVPSAWHM